MAKKTHKIEAFEGGINKKSDPRDIEDNELSKAFNVLLSLLHDVSGETESSYETKF